MYHAEISIAMSCYSLMFMLCLSDLAVFELAEFFTLTFLTCVTCHVKNWSYLIFNLFLNWFGMLLLALSTCCSMLELFWPFAQQCWTPYCSILYMTLMPSFYMYHGSCFTLILVHPWSCMSMLNWAYAFVICHTVIPCSFVNSTLLYH